MASFIWRSTRCCWGSTSQIALPASGHGSNSWLNIGLQHMAKLISEFQSGRFGPPGTHLDCTHVHGHQCDLHSAQRQTELVYPRLCFQPWSGRIRMREVRMLAEKERAS